MDQLHEPIWWLGDDRATLDHAIGIAIDPSFPQACEKEDVVALEVDPVWRLRFVGALLPLEESGCRQRRALRAERATVARRCSDRLDARVECRELHFRGISNPRRDKAAAELARRTIAVVDNR